MMARRCFLEPLNWQARTASFTWPIMINLLKHQSYKSIPQSRTRHLAPSILLTSSKLFKQRLTHQSNKWTLEAQKPPINSNNKWITLRWTTTIWDTAVVEWGLCVAWTYAAARPRSKGPQLMLDIDAFHLGYHESLHHLPLVAHPNHSRLDILPHRRSSTDLFLRSHSRWIAAIRTMGREEDWCSTQYV